MTTMKAFRIHTYGGSEALVLENVPIPQTREGEILIRVHAAGVNPLDWKVSEGYGKDRLNHKLPLILGWDVSGVIEASGSGVTNFKAGDDVYGLLDVRRDGAYTEYVAARADHLAPKPKTINHVQAAAVPITGLTAWQSLFDAAGLAPGQTVLIHAAAGGVGSFAVQLAKWRGAKVLGTASSANVSFLKGLGADEVIDYKANRFEERAKGVDVVLDTLGGEIQDRSWKVLKKGGILVSTVGIRFPEKAAELGVRAVSFFVRPNAAHLMEIGRLIDKGDIKPAVETVLPFAQARKALELSRSGHSRGRIVLQVRD
jgi:NADPH:quinone reductase-like Zn-dependent oxidoreductase